MSTSGLLRSMKAKLGGGGSKKTIDNKSTASLATARTTSTAEGREHSASSEIAAVPSVSPTTSLDHKGSLLSREAMVQAFAGKSARQWSGGNDKLLY